MLTLDNILGGGIPRGRIIEIYGPESSGKTSLALCIMAEAQKKGDFVGMIDAEHAFDRAYASNLGLSVDSSAFAFSTPDTGEDALEVRAPRPQRPHVCSVPRVDATPCHGGSWCSDD